MRPLFWLSVAFLIGSFINQSKTYETGPDGLSGETGTLENKESKNLSLMKSSLKNGSYIVFCPERLDIKSRLKIYLLVLNAKGKTHIEIYVNNTLKKRTTLVSGKPKISTLFLWGIEKYNVTVLAKSGVKFVEKFVVKKNIPAPKGAILVQMDRLSFQENSQVKFLCFALDRKLKTIRYPIDINIYDSKNNLISSWEDQRSSTGVISKTLKLSDNPSTGMWKIQLHQPKTNLTEKVSFFVNTTEKNPASLKISGDHFVYSLGLYHGHFLKQTLNITFNARYLSGEPINGFIIVRITTNTIPAKKYIRILKINGKLNYQMNVKKFLKSKITKSKEQVLLSINATVADKRTKFYEKSGTFNISSAAYPLEMLSPNRVVQKLGMENELILYFRRNGSHDQPLRPEDLSGRVNVTFIHGKNSTNKLYKINSNGSLPINLPNEYVERIHVIFVGTYQMYNYKMNKSINVVQYQAGPPQMEATLIENHPYAGDEVSFKIKCTIQMLKIFYTIFYEESPIRKGVQFSDSNVTTLSIQTKTTWVPLIKVAFMAVTASQPKNFILLDVVMVHLDLKFNYKVESVLSNKILIAGSNQTLTTKSSKGSTVFTMGCNQQFHQYITKKMIINKLYQSAMQSVANSPKPCNLFSVLEFHQLHLMSNVLSLENQTSCYQSHEEEPGRFPPQPEEPNYGPEVLWLEEHFHNGIQKDFKFQVPTEAGKWTVSSFAVNPQTGISLAEKNLKFLTYENKAISFDLPQCMFLNERLKLKVKISNFFPKSKKFMVFFFDISLLCPESNNQISVQIPSNSNILVSFTLCANSLGNKTVTVLLKADGRFLDIIKDYLLVKPSGRPEYFSQEKRLPLGTKRTFRMKIPGPRRDEVEGSRKISFSVTGDIMSFFLSNLNNLVMLPLECGEHIANTFCCNINIYYYLKGRRSLTNKRRRKIRELVKLGYQNQLRYQKRDGSYKIFRKDRRGNIWVTARVCQNFVEALMNRMNVLIDERKLLKSVRFLIRKQQKSGAYREIGRITHPKLQGELGKPSKSLTAYVLISLISIRERFWRLLRRPIRRAANYLKQLDIHDHHMHVYTLSLMFYAFVKMGDWRYFWKIETVLLKKAKKENNMIYWEGKYSVEQTCYVLLAYSYKPNNRIVKKIVDWILMQTNQLGGFSNNQNAAVCVEALSRFGLRLPNVRKAEIVVRTDKAFNHTYRINNQRNLFRVKTSTLDSKTRNVLINLPLKRPGMAVFKLSCSLTLNSEYDDNFGLSVSVNVITERVRTIKICYEWNKPINPGLLYSDVQLPSGYIKRSVTCSGRPCDKRNKCSKADRCVVKTRDMKLDYGITLYLEQINYRKPFCVDIKVAPHVEIENRRTMFFVTTTSYFTGERCIKHYKI